MTIQELTLARAKQVVDSLPLPEPTKAYVHRVSTSAPARPVGNQTGRNLLIDFACQKMGFTQEVESATVEGKYRLFLSFTKDVVAYFPQPETRTLTIIDKRGTKKRVPKTFDFLVIYLDHIELIECKPLHWLAKEAQGNPQMVKARSGQWVSPLLEEQLSAEGLIFRYISDADIPTSLARNITVLEPLLGQIYSTARALAAIRKSLQSPTTLQQLIDLQDGYEKQDVFLAIQKGDIFVDLERDLLAAPARTQVYLNRKHAELAEAISTSVSVPEVPAPFLTPGSILKLNGEDLRFAERKDGAFQLINSQGELVTIKQGALETLVRSGAVQVPQVPPQTTAEAQAELVDRFEPEEYAIAQRRSAFIVAWRKDHGVREEAYGLAPVTRRQKQRWISAHRTAKRRFGNGTFGLMRRKSPIPRKSRLPEPAIQLMKVVADELYFTPEQRSSKVCYRELQARAAAVSIHCPSYKTFRIFLPTLRNKADTAQARVSERAAYQFSATEKWDENWLTADDFSEKYAHLDATQSDVELVDSLTGQPLGRPWFIRLFSPALHAPWAFVVSYDEPSYRDTMLVLRVAYERWGFLPRYISVDNGMEFHHTAVDQLLALFGIHLVTRPPAKSRFGSAIESSFQRLNKECFHALRGNTQATKNVRQITKSRSPKTMAVWTLPKLHEHLIEYDKTVWETVAPDLGTSPKEALEHRKRHTPDMPRISLPTDLAAVAFMPPPPHGEAKVQPGRGVCIGGVYYWADEFVNARIEGTTVEVRYDPFDFSIAFARVGGKWCRCKAKHYPQLNHCTEKQARIAAIERRHVRRMYPAIREKERGARLLLLDRRARETERMLLQKRRDAEARALRPVQSSEAAEPKKSTHRNWGFRHLRDDGETAIAA